jgi:hypothetical protein
MTWHVSDFKFSGRPTTQIEKKLKRDATGTQIFASAASSRGLWHQMPNCGSSPSPGGCPRYDRREAAQ